MCASPTTTRPDTAALHGVDFTNRPGGRWPSSARRGGEIDDSFQLLLRFYEPTAGRITLDGPRSARDVAREPSAPHGAGAGKTPVISAASARANIRFGRPDASDAEVEAAARRYRAPSS